MKKLNSTFQSISGPEQNLPTEAVSAQTTSSTTAITSAAVTSSDTVAATQNPAVAPNKTVSGETKVRRSNKSSERIPKLLILSVQHGSLVECSMENKSKTIKFKFDISDVNPIDVANDLVKTIYTNFVNFMASSDTISSIFQISKDLLSTSQRNIFADMVRDIVRQLKLNPNQIPVPSSHRRTGSGLEKVSAFSADFPLVIQSKKHFPERENEIYSWPLILYNSNALNKKKKNEK